MIQNIIKWVLGLALAYCIYTVAYQYLPGQENITILKSENSIFQFADSDVKKETSFEQVMEKVSLPPGNYKFGFNLDSFEVVSGKIKKNEFLSQILTKHDVDYQQIDKLAKRSVDTFDVRSLNYNKDYTILKKLQDSVNLTQYFIYEPNDFGYVVFDLKDSTNVAHYKNKVTRKLREASGTIEGSLYLTMLENELNPELCYKLADVYAWTIDFYRINKGDKFKVIYEEQMIDGKAVGIGDIKACWFNHSDEDFYAFEFEQDNLMDFYDEEGKSLRKQFLKAPLKFSRISSRFSKNRYHPVQKRNKPHLGTDYAAPTGTPIRSVGDGKVIERAYKKYNGNYVKVRHNGTYTTQYLHMSKFAKDVKVGDYVRQGDIIGYVGSTGLATGPHLCFRFWKNGEQVDPFKQKLPPSKPVKEELMTDYKVVMDEWKPKLDAIEIKGEAPSKIAEAINTSESESLVN